VVDCGGGTVDITAHEMDSTHGELHEIYKATGGPHGSVGQSIRSLPVILVRLIMFAKFITMY